MVYYSRVLVSGRQKLAIFIALVAGALFVMYNQTVLDAFFAFSFGGIIPGTDIVIPPDIFLSGVIGIFGLLLFGTILRMKLRSTRRRREVRIPVRVVTEKHIPVLEPSAALPELVPPLYAEPSIPKVSRRTRRTFFMVTIFRNLKDIVRHAALLMGRSLRATYRAVRKAAGLVVIGLGRAAVGIYIVAAACTTAAYRLTLIAGSLVVQASIVFGHQTARTAAIIWRWAIPHLRKCDEWLEITIRKIEAWARRKLRGYEAAHILRAVFTETRKSTREMDPRLALHAVHKKAVSAKDQ